MCDSIVTIQDFLIIINDSSFKPESFFFLQFHRDKLYTNTLATLVFCISFLHPFAVTILGKTADINITFLTTKTKHTLFILFKNICQIGNTDS